MRNSVIIEYVKDITVAKLSSNDHPATGENGQAVADFMQHVYDKLVELDKDAD